MRDLEAILKGQRNNAESMAWQQLARGDFQEFGHEAARWRYLTFMLGDDRRNPFATVVRAARVELKARGEKIPRATHL